MDPAANNHVRDMLIDGCHSSLKERRYFWWRLIGLKQSPTCSIQGKEFLAQLELIKSRHTKIAITNGEIVHHHCK
jgi:hypothetical protein